MLKKRIIPVQLLLNNRLVKTKGFDSYRDVGDPVASSKVYNSQLADELVFLNIERDANRRSIHDLVRLIDAVSEVCFMPLALGGGICTIEDAATLIRSGADKVVVNSVAYRDPDLLREISDRFGAQALVVSVDVRKEGSQYVLFSNCGHKREAVSLVDHIRAVVKAGAGEILLNSIDRDGAMGGYDIELIQAASQVAKLPLIACGGAGNYYHMLEAFQKTSASALACGSLFNFTDSNPIRAKAFLGNYGIPFKVV